MDSPNHLSEKLDISTVEATRLDPTIPIHNMSNTVVSTATTPRTEKRSRGEEAVGPRRDAADALEAPFSTTVVGFAKYQAKNLRPSAWIPDHLRFLCVRCWRGKWQSELRCLNMWLGTFATPEEAAFVHDIASLATLGTRARLNFGWTSRYAARTRDIEKRCAGTLNRVLKVAVHEEIMLICKSIMAELPNLLMLAIHAKMSAGGGTISMQILNVDSVQRLGQATTDPAAAAAAAEGATACADWVGATVDPYPWVIVPEETHLPPPPPVRHHVARHRINVTHAKNAASPMLIPAETNLPASPPVRHHVAHHCFSVTYPSSSTLPSFSRTHPPHNATSAGSPSSIPADLPKSSLIPVSGSAAREYFAEGKPAVGPSAANMSAAATAPSLAPPLSPSLQPSGQSIISSAFTPATPPSPRSSPLVPSLRSHAPASASVPFPFSSPPLGSALLAPLPASIPPNPCQGYCYCQPKQQQQQAAAAHDTCHPHSAAVVPSAARPKEISSSAVVSIEGSVGRLKPSNATQFQQQLLGSQTQEQSQQQSMQSRQSRQPVARQLKQLPLPSCLPRKHQAQVSMQRAPLHRLRVERGNQQKENWQQDVVGGAAGAAILGGEPYPALIPPLIPSPMVSQGHTPSGAPDFLGNSNFNHRTGPLPKLVPFLLSAIANGKASALAAAATLQSPESLRLFGNSTSNCSTRSGITTTTPSAHYWFFSYLASNRGSISAVEAAYHAPRQNAKPPDFHEPSIHSLASLERSYTFSLP
ncbi:unnamed protein product [Closterium sp. NIES-54]